ncbi:MAG TPA: UDP-galactopyranose mutase [Puia sp.]
MDIQDFSYVIVGSGLAGAVIAERIASQLHQPVLVLEKRDHIGGNCYSATDSATGIEYHKYGTHIFHTSNEKVWNYIRKFTGFNNYQHRVLSSYQGQTYQFPINLETINHFYRLNLKPFEVDTFMDTKRDRSITDPANFEEKALSLVGPDLYEAFFKHYTIKQWQVNPKDLPAAIFNRLPFRKNYVDNYFFDTWQGIPDKGYTRLFENLLADKRIKVLVNTDFFDIRDRLNPNACLIYSGPIDRYFDYKHGKLTWRTLRFEQETLDYDDFQGNSVINYPGPDVPFTRIHEPKHLHPEHEHRKDKTIIFREYSLFDQGDNPYYPIASAENQQLLSLYKEEAARLQNVFITGRLGDYKYYDMHHTIARSLEIFETGILPLITASHAV